MLPQQTIEAKEPQLEESAIPLDKKKPVASKRTKTIKKETKDEKKKK